MSNNIQRLGDVLAGRMKRTAKGAVPVTVELGTIQSNMSLKVDSIGMPIPQSGYMVPLHLTCGENRTGEAYVEEHGSHDHSLPSAFRKLKAGDRVLVAWVGYTPVIVDIVVAGNTITN